MKKKFKSVKDDFLEILNRPDMVVLPSQLAFNFVLALVPTLSLIAYIASIFNITLTDINTYFDLNLSPAIFNLIKPAVAKQELHFGFILILLFTIYIASNGMGSVIITADNIYGIKQSTFIERKIKSIIMVFIIMLLFTFILLVPVFGNFIINLIENYFSISWLYQIFNTLKYPFSFFVIYAFIKVLYVLAPSKQIPSSYVTRGALFTSLSWIAATAIYMFYTSRIANYAAIYSGLSNLAILMIWIYFLGFIFVIGMGINYKYEIKQLSKKKV